MFAPDSPLGRPPPASVQVPGERRPSLGLDIAITLLGLGSIILVLIFYNQAFPSAAIDLQLSRTEIAARSQSYLENRGYDLADYEFALTFEEDVWASFYMQQTLGVPETNRRIRAEELPVWYWHARWFRPLQKEEFSLDLAPDGTIQGFSHSILEDTPGDALSMKEARARAIAYLSQDRGWKLTDWEEVSASTEYRPSGRVDHYLEWKRRGFSLGESELRLYIVVQGGNVDGYSYWFKVPEEFQRYFREQRSRAAFFNNLSFYAGMVLFAGAAALAYVIAASQKRLAWWTGFFPALAFALVGFLSNLNELPLNKVYYPTTQDYAMFWLEHLGSLFVTVVISLVGIMLLWAGSREVGKLAWPRRDKILARSGDRWGALARSSWRGFMLAGLMGGYTVLFYLAATQLLGGWVPLDAPYTNMYATPVPFLTPLTIGLQPAMMEELLFRLTGIGALLWLMRSWKLPKTARWALALIIPGILWAFAHMGYVRDPIYMRGIELTIAAIFLEGLFFLAFDLTTTLVAHFAFNAALTALPLLRSTDPYFVFCGAVVFAVMAAPLVPGLVRAIRRRIQGQALEKIPLSISPATVEDIEPLTALPKPQVDWAALLADPRAVVHCLWAGQEVGGVAAGRLHKGETSQVIALYVAPAWRRRYAGSTLVDQLVLALQELGAEQIQVPVDSEDKVGIAFWASQGWWPARRIYRWSLAPAPSQGWRERFKKAWKKLWEVN